VSDDAESEPIAIEPMAQGGCLLPLRVTPGAKRNAVGGCHDGALKVSVTQIAEKGKANQQVVKLLAKALGMKKSQLELVSGETSREKRIACRGLHPAELQTRIAELGGGK